MCAISCAITPGELDLVLREREEARVHADVPADEREGVDAVVLHHEEVEVAARALDAGEQARAERVM
jgi:hypothetical protein